MNTQLSVLGARTKNDKKYSQHNGQNGNSACVKLFVGESTSAHLSHKNGWTETNGQDARWKVSEPWRGASGMNLERAHRKGASALIQGRAPVPARTAARSSVCRRDVRSTGVKARDGDFTSE